MSPLSPRQAEVVRLSWFGLTNARIGRALGLSPHAVKMYLSEAYRRLGVADACGSPRTRAAVRLWRIERRPWIGGADPQEEVWPFPDEGC